MIVSAGLSDLPRGLNHAGGRRWFLRASTGLVIVFSLTSSSRDLTRRVTSPAPGRLYAWLAINSDNTATLFTGKVDTGTGTSTALAQIAAEELDFPLEHIDVMMGTTSETVDQGPTYGSGTIRYAGPQIRQAAAACRQVLLGIAARHFNAPIDELVVSRGAISVSTLPHLQATFGELVGGKRLDYHIGATGAMFDMCVAPGVPTKDPSRYTVVGQPATRKDIPAKVTGRFTYLQDLRIEGMLHGRVVRPYGVGARLVSVDASCLKDVPGFIRVVQREDFLGVVAETEWSAVRAAESLGSTLNPGGPDAEPAKWSPWNGLPDMDQIWTALREAGSSSIALVKRGAVDKALAAATRTVKATYRTPFQMHGSIGPSCAIADVKRTGATFWSSTQMPHQLKRDMAQLLRLPLESIEVRWCEASGAYGRNGADHAVADAAVMSQAVGRPVRVQWMRWDEHGWEPKGPAILQDLSGALDEDGRVTAWRHHMWIPTIGDTHLIAAQLIGEPGITGHTGRAHPAVTDSYDFASAEVICHAEGRVALLTSWLRSPGQFETTFAVESFVDELATMAGQDPLAFRLTHLKDPRALGVLQAAAHAYGWQIRPATRRNASDPRPVRVADRPLAGRGLAWADRDGVYVATIADVTVDVHTGDVKVGRVVVAHDCGLVINPDGLRNQVEGNVIQSLSRALHEEVKFDTARVTSRDWIKYPILRFTEIPDSIDIVMVNNRLEYPPYGAGEASTCPMAAVISNAVFDATGTRLRQMPFRSDRVKAAIDLGAADATR